MWCPEISSRPCARKIGGHVLGNNMPRNNPLKSAKTRTHFPSRVTLGLTVLLALAASALLVRAIDNSDHVPSNVSWTMETLSAASSGDAFQGMLLAKRCDHCHGTEGFSATASIPNLAGM